MFMPQVDRSRAIRRAAGFALVPIEGDLRHFVRVATARGEPHVVATTAIACATLAPSEAQRAYRRQTVIRCARFMHAEEPRHEIPPVGVCRGRRPRPTPYICSDEESQQLLRHAARLGPPGSWRPHTDRTLFGLLAVTGMRGAEARNLRRQDVTADGVLIRETKGHKSRRRPLHATPRAALDRYLSHRQRVASPTAQLLISRRYGQRSRTVVIRTFPQVRTAAGIPPQPGWRRPRLIELRHTFAVRGLEACPEAREAVGRQTLALTT
ncbi:MAG: tyrosine-type recombinase/integrase [Gammaproteobacteria bacterium]